MLFSDLDARERVLALLDRGSFRELAGPDDSAVSPHLEIQGITAQADDGVIVGKGELDGRSILVISLDGTFLGGGIGEVSGAKISCALELARMDAVLGRNAMPAVILFDSGGGRLPEGNYGQLAIAEIISALIALRPHVPVVGVIPGKIGAYGGMSVVAALCTDLVMTRNGRLGLSGAKVIEQEAGKEELNAKDRSLISAMIGGEQRTAMDLADRLVEDEAEEIRSELIASLIEGNSVEKIPRSRKVGRYLSFLQAKGWEGKLNPEKAVDVWKKAGMKRIPMDPVRSANAFNRDNALSGGSKSRGEVWFDLLTEGFENCSEVQSVQVADVLLGGRRASYLAIVPDTGNPFLRARNGELGLMEGWMIAKHVREMMEKDRDGEKRAIIAIVDVPSQAFGSVEELLGIHLALAAASDAYASARQAGHPVVALLVGNANGGAFLVHGMQANRIVALDDPSVQVQVMSKESIARVTGRPVEEVEDRGKKVMACAFDVRSFAALGAVDRLIEGVDAQRASKKDRDQVLAVLETAIMEIQSSPLRDLSIRWTSAAGRNGGRQATNRIRNLLEKQWLGV